MRTDTELIKSLVYQTKGIITDRALAGAVREKGRADFVTSVDTGVQDFLGRELLARYSGTQLLGEKGHRHKIDPNGAIWILDPIDGTTNLIYDYRMSAVSLALCDGGEIVTGIVYNPFTDEMFTAEKGGGAVNPLANSDILASNGFIHRELMRFLQ